jgi:hypothetical protein
MILKVMKRILSKCGICKTRSVKHVSPDNPEVLFCPKSFGRRLFHHFYQKPTWLRSQARQKKYIYNIVYIYIYIAFHSSKMILTFLSKFQEQGHKSDEENPEIVSLWDIQRS